jgi:hypothetical protein
MMTDDPRFTKEIRAFAQQLNDQFRETYAQDPEFRRTFNRYLLDEFGIHVVPDEPRPTLAQLGEGLTRH